MLAGHGGVVIGSEMSGGVHNVTVSNCVFNGTDNGIRIKSVRGRGGVVENISFNNIVMDNIKKGGIVINLFYANIPPEPVSERTPIFRDIHISGITGRNINQACVVKGLEEMPISNISFDNINMDAKTGFDISKAKDIRLNNVQVNVQLGAAFKLNDIENSYLNNINTVSPLAAKPLIEANNTRGMFITGCSPSGNQSFLSLSGEKSDYIVLSNDYLGRLSHPIEKQDNLKKDIHLIEK